MSKKKLPSKPDTCQNCDHLLDDHMEYCPECGQKAMPEHLTLKYFFHELLSHYFSIDSKFFNTLVPLITKPAFLSLEFIAGRRIRYISPIQLFVFISFLYFLVDSFMFLKDAANTQNFVVMNENNEKVSIDSLDMELFELDTLSDANDVDDIDSEVVSFVKSFVLKAQEFNKLDKDEQNERINQMISYFIFILTPLFALLLGLFFKTRNRHYLENLIFALHVHAFYFFIAIIFMVFDRLIPESVSDILFIGILITYLLLALKRFYSRLWVSSVFRLIGLGALYGFMVLICFICSVVLSIFL
jgi:hypothetical protein